MPELPEVEVLVRHLDAVLPGKTIRTADVRRQKVLGKTSRAAFAKALEGATFQKIRRRAKFLLFDCLSRKDKPFLLVGHLGMTGRMYLLAGNLALPKHAAVVFNLGREKFVFEDTRYFGRLTLDTTALKRLGPEPLEPECTAGRLREALAHSSQPIKVKLLDQSVVAGIGNIYASEALFRVGISPRLAARRLNRKQIIRLLGAIRQVLREAIRFGSTVPLAFSGNGGDSLFYYGNSLTSGKSYEERLRVYDRHGLDCVTCGNPIRRIYQAGRSTFYCKVCQHG